MDTPSKGFSGYDLSPLCIQYSIAGGDQQTGRVFYNVSILSRCHILYNGTLYSSSLSLKLMFSENLLVRKKYILLLTIKSFRYHGA